MRWPLLSVWLALALAASTPLVALAGDPPQDDSKAAKARGNRLAGETSPYLLQHAHNPVDWYPWGPEAFARARDEQKPLFVSVGYSTCYWCHVMERESFENVQTAAYLNENFVCIKVDREERPDVDQIYMAAVQAFQGRGGWPMTVFCFPDGRPFFGGTYFPPAERDGMESFPSILRRVSAAWRDHRTDLSRDADLVTEVVRKATSVANNTRRVPLTAELSEAGLASLASQFDPDFGGFGYDPDQPRRPKFPEPTNLLYLLESEPKAAKPPSRAVATMVEYTLDHMSRGGIRDQLGGGYHRYSTDRAWAVPHFEKMLYDNALLASVFSKAFEIDRANLRWKREAEAILESVARDFTSKEGVFYSALDAEVDADEGGSYVWSRAEIERELGDSDDAKLFLKAYGIDRAPNFEAARYVLLLPQPFAELARETAEDELTIEAKLAPLRARLLKVRQARKQPTLDDKVITSWNALMIGAYADAARAFHNDTYLQAAERAGDFLWDKMRNHEGRLLRTLRGQAARLPAYLEDYAYLAWGFTKLYQVSDHPRWLARAQTLADRMIGDFADTQDGGFFFVADDQDTLLARPKDFSDGALPSANAVAVLVLLQLDRLNPTPRYQKVARAALESASGSLARAPSASPTMLSALRLLLQADSTPLAITAITSTNPDPLALSVPEDLVTVGWVGPVPETARPGEEIKATLELEVAKGWHLYANPTGAENLKPTRVEVVHNDLVALSAVAYPTGEAKRLSESTMPINIYQGTFRVPISLLVSKEALGPLQIVLRLHFQPCDDQVCLAPAQRDITLNLEVKSRAIGDK
jgi:uncharacterized protein YyaL (SSP411 family)